MAKNNNSGERAQWASNLGFILAAAGSAVGLGNIWKFPGKAYNGGGGAFCAGLSGRAGKIQRVGRQHARPD